RVVRFNGAVARTRRRPGELTIEDWSAIRLQWSRRANATETVGEALLDGLRSGASMEPSRERDGDGTITRDIAPGERCFNGAVARTRRRLSLVEKGINLYKCFNGA